MPIPLLATVKPSPCTQPRTACGYPLGIPLPLVCVAVTPQQLSEAAHIHWLPAPGLPCPQMLLRTQYFPYVCEAQLSHVCQTAEALEHARAVVILTVALAGVPNEAPVALLSVNLK